MRKRNVHVQFWLDKKEAEAFNKKVKRSGLSREAYLRHLVNGLVPQDAPPPAYYDFMRELHRIGGNLNQIAQKAHVLGVIDERRYDEEMRKFDQLVRDITKAVILPRAMDTKGSPRSLLRGEKEHPRSGEPFDACGKSGKRSAVRRGYHVYLAGERLAGQGSHLYRESR